MTVTHYVWDPLSDNVLMETDENNVTQAVYTHEPDPFGNLISQRRDDETSYYHFDGLGSTRELTDESETVTDTNMYDAWGVNVASTGTTENPFLWVGEQGYYHDPETEDYCVRARIYGPEIARWTSVDPVGLHGLGMLYEYAANSPITRRDPSGWFPDVVDADEDCPRQRTVRRGISPGSTSNTPGQAPFSNTGIIVLLSKKYGLRMLECGGYQYAIAWRKRDITPQEGRYVIQHIVWKFTIRACDENKTDITLETLKSQGRRIGNKDGGRTLDYWEAWQFKAETHDTEVISTHGYDDLFYNKPFDGCTQGHIEQKGWYTEAKGKIPPSMAVTPGSPAGEAPFSWKKPEGVVYTKENPLWRRHWLLVEWNCCQSGAPPEQSEPPADC